MRKLYLLLVSAAVLASRPCAAQNPIIERQIVAARDTIWHAWFGHDTALLRRFLPPAAATLEGPRGARWSDRTQIVEGSAGFASSKSSLVDLRFVNTRIAQSGHSALVTSEYTTVVESGGKRDSSRGRATELFVYTGGTWVNPYWQLEPAGAITAGGRIVPLPDTLGANFAIADSASKLGELTDYDRLVGTWEFEFQTRRPDGTFNMPFNGHWTFDKRPGGALIEDHWRPDDPSEPMGFSLYTYRNFDPARKVWQMIGASASGGEIQPGLTWEEATEKTPSPSRADTPRSD